MSKQSTTDLATEPRASDLPGSELDRIATKHGARRAPGAADVDQTFVCCGRVHSNGKLHLLLARPGARLLIEQPDELATVPSGARLVVRADFRVALAPDARRERSGHDR